MLVELGSDPCFPRARASEYSTERGRAYLLSSERVQESPRRYGRQARLADSNGACESFDKVETIEGFGFEPNIPLMLVVKTNITFI